MAGRGVTRFRGVQAPAVNDGSADADITAAKDSIVLVRNR
jgi:hypothetical protein